MSSESYHSPRLAPKGAAEKGNGVTNVTWRSSQQRAVAHKPNISCRRGGAVVSPGTGRVLRGKETGTGVRFIIMRLQEGSWTMAWELQRRRGMLSSGAGDPGAGHWPACADGALIWKKRELV